MADLLAVETSAEACSAALAVGGQITDFCEHAPLRHAEVLLPAVERLLQGSGRDLSALDAIAFGRGPGSFTSLRIGIGVVQGLAWASGLPVIPVSSLAAAAQAAVDEGTVPGTRLVVALDARMDEVYTAEFCSGADGLVRADGTERVCGPEQLDLPVTGDFIAVGNGFERFDVLRRAAATSLACRPSVWPTANAVCRLAADWLRSHAPLPAAMAQPVYLRNQVAVKPSSGQL
jgi:tRNA threonylcarbamoyladenosine biosynthesis protein TsaB